MNELTNYHKHMYSKFYGNIPTVTLYTTANCNKCKQLKAQLDKLNIPYTEIDIINDTEEMANLHMQNIVIFTAPTLRIGDIFLTILEV